MILLCRCGLRWVAVAGEPLPALCVYCRSGWAAKTKPAPPPEKHA